MDNLTFKYHTLSIEGLKVTPQSAYSAFVVFLLLYLVTVMANVGMVVLIVFEKKLHDPMHVLLCNLPLNDVIGPTAVVPSLLKNMFKEASERSVSYVECVIQAYFSHLFATTSHSILMVMAFDRYVAICQPLRYPSVMSSAKVAKLTASAWLVPAVVVTVLIGLTARLSHCASVIQSPVCDNASLFKLSCENVSINNIYGLCLTVVLMVSSLGCILATYLRIAIVCLTSKNKQLNVKAMKTCSTHLAVYVIMMVSGFTIVFLHRFPDAEDSRKMATILFNVVPPLMNPLIYGVQTKEIRHKLALIFRGNKN